jgi:hypothetical protein
MMNRQGAKNAKNRGKISLNNSLANLAPWRFVSLSLTGAAKR